MASLRDADLDLKLRARESEERILKAQHRLLALRLQMGGLIGSGQLGPPLCVLFEGWDASGQGVSIRRREQAALKRWNLTGGDCRNMARRADYEEAVEEMLATTDHELAPWHVIAAESTRYARVRVLEIVISTIEDALRICGQSPVEVA